LEDSWRNPILKINIHGSTSHLSEGAAGKQYAVTWYRVTNGEYAQGGSISGSGWTLLDAPWQGEDVVLYLTKEPNITVTSPNGLEALPAETLHEITWTSEGDIQNVKIQYSTDSGTNWIEIVASTENDGSYVWEVPNNPSLECLIRISDVDDDPSDDSDALFLLTPPLCKADFNDDYTVDVEDLAIFALVKGTIDCLQSPGDCVCDIDNDNDVDGKDFNVLGAEIGRSDCP
jgi:hypothetical protein